MKNKATQRRIAVDIDGVLADTLPALNDFYNEMHGTDFKVGDYRHYDLEKTWGGTRGDAVKIVEAFYKSPEFLRITPVAYSPEAVAVLSRKREIFSVTSRPDWVQNETEIFIRRFYGNRIKRVFYTGQYSNHAARVDKLSICVSKKVEILIEDCLEIAVACSEGGIPVLLMDTLYNVNGQNKFRLPSNLTIVKNWLEILERFERT